MPSAAVDLPHPDSPTSPYERPRPISKEMPRSTGRSTPRTRYASSRSETSRFRRLRAHRSYASRTPSATRLTATTRLAIARAGKRVIHQYGCDQRVVLVDLRRPVRRGRGNAEAQESERGDGEDRIAESHRELDDHERHDVREDLREHDVLPPLTAEPSGLHVVELGFGEHARPHCARDDGSEDQPDDQGHDQVGVPEAATMMIAVMISGSARIASTNRLMTSSTTPRSSRSRAPARCRAPSR